MNEKKGRAINLAITLVLAFQLAGCGTLLYPERRGQVPGRLDVGVVILDTIGLLFFIIPGVIAFAVDFGNGCIYLPARPAVISSADLRQIKFDPKHTSLAQLEKIIKDQTGQDITFTQDRMRVRRLKSKNDMIEHFAQAFPDVEGHKLAFNL